MSSSSPGADRRYWLLVGDVPSGPFTVEQVHDQLSTGKVTWQTRACPVGGSTWLPLVQTPGLGPTPAPDDIPSVIPVPTPSTPPQPEQKMSARLGDKPGRPAAPAGPPHTAPARSHATHGSSGKLWHWWYWLVVVGLGLGLFKYAGCIPEDVSTPGDRDAAQRVAKEVAEANAIPVTAQGLTQEWRSNDIAANQKYKGKVLEVSGTVTLVRGGTQGPWGSRPFVQLGGIRCDFKSDREVENLAAGQFVTIRGKYQGDGVLRYCILRR